MGPDFPGTQWGDEIPEDAVFYKFRFHLSEAARPYVEAAGLDPNSGFSRISIEFDAMSADPATIELEQTAKWLLDARDIEARKTPLHKLAEEADA